LFHQIRATLRRRHAIVRWHEEDLGAARHHETCGLGKEGVATEENAEGHAIDCEDRRLIAGTVDRPIYRRVQLSVDAQNGPAREHCGCIVEVPVVTAFGEADDRGHPVARERCEGAGQVIRARLYRDAMWLIDVICQSIQQGLGAAEEPYPEKFASIDLPADQ
jgi:hypothetical protein